MRRRGEIVVVALLVLALTGCAARARRERERADAEAWQQFQAMVLSFYHARELDRRYGLAECSQPYGDVRTCAWTVIAPETFITGPSPRIPLKGTPFAIGGHRRTRHVPGVYVLCEINADGGVVGTCSAMRR